MWLYVVDDCVCGSGAAFCKGGVASLACVEIAGEYLGPKCFPSPRFVKVPVLLRLF